MKVYKNQRIEHVFWSIPIILLFVVMSGDFSDEKIYWMLGIFAFIFLSYLYDKLFVDLVLSTDTVTNNWWPFKKKVSIAELDSFLRYKSVFAPYISLVDVFGKVRIKNISAYFKTPKDAEEFYLFLKSKNPSIKTNIDFSKPLDIPFPPKDYFSEPK